MINQEMTISIQNHHNVRIERDLITKINAITLSKTRTDTCRFKKNKRLNKTPHNHHSIGDAAI